MRLATLLLLALGLGSPALAEDGDDHVTEAGDLRILHAWTNATDDDTTRVFMEIENGGTDATRLMGASAEIAAAHGLEGVPLAAGGDPVALSEGLPIAAGRTIELGPEGAYILLDGLTQDLHEGDRLEVTLLFEPDGPVAIEVEVLDDTAREHPHAGHDH